MNQRCRSEDSHILKGTQDQKVLVPRGNDGGSGFEGALNHLSSAESLVTPVTRESSQPGESRGGQ